MDEVRRPEDNELCGFVALGPTGWESLTVFMVAFGVHPDRETAVLHVREQGLVALSKIWTLIDPATGDEEPVCIREAGPRSITIVRDVVPWPGAPTLLITTTELAEGIWQLRP